MGRLLQNLRGIGRAEWLAALGILTLLVALRWNSFSVPLTRDEAEYSYAAQILQRGLHPYEHAFIQKPPMMIYTYRVAGWLAPETPWFPRVLAAVFAAGVVCLVGLVARLEFGRGVGLTAMWLTPPLLMSPGLWQFTANTEMFMILPLWGPIALFVLRRHQCIGRWAWCAAGCLGAAGFWYRYTALPVLAVLFVAWSVEEGRRSGRKVLGCWLLGLAGAMATSLAVLAPFLIWDGGKRLWECTVTFNRYYRASASFGASGLLAWLEAVGGDWWILFLLVAFLLFRPIRRSWFWMGMFLAGWVSTGASALGQYYVVVMPLWALLAAVAIKELAALAAGGLRWSETGVRRGLLVAVMVLVCLPDVPWVTCTRAEFAAVKAYGGNPFLESETVARRVAQLTSPDDAVYVAGSEPQILFYANRVSPTRFVIAYPLMIPTPMAEAYQREAMQALERRPPAVIVLARSALSWLPQPGSPQVLLPYLEKLLADRYEPVGGWIGEGPTGSWQEPLPESEHARCSLIVFRRKDPSL